MSDKLDRLQKVIAQSGVTSRRKAEKLIADGKVKVNDKVVSELGTKVSPNDRIEVDGVPLEKEKPVYYLLYKPRGVISSLKDDKGRKVVTDLIGEIEERVYPVGRLDYDTSGILLLTNDGEFANQLMHPRYGVEKVYVAKLEGIPDKMELGRLRKGVESENDVLKALRYKILSVDRKKNSMLLELTLNEGKNRHVRRMMDVLGYPVQKLKRERYGVLTLEGLQPGGFRPLNPKEVKQMRNLAVKNVEK
ncbi:pseudouridine synthase [Virgibacillus sediminis]|uniref:Pseudouridine synthase n=1 Tax=Virgibacillus sediminis TaxID=202260 RepID=A0ABV7A606_9BACI